MQYIQGKADRNHNLVSYYHSGQAPIYCSSKSQHYISLWVPSGNTCQRNSEAPSKPLCKHKGWIYHSILGHVMFVNATNPVQTLCSRFCSAVPSLEQEGLSFGAVSESSFSAFDSDATSAQHHSLIRCDLWWHRILELSELQLMETKTINTPTCPWFMVINKWDPAVLQTRKSVSEFETFGAQVCRYFFEGT